MVNKKSTKSPNQRPSAAAKKKSTNNTGPLRTKSNNVKETASVDESDGKHKPSVKAPSQQRSQKNSALKNKSIVEQSDGPLRTSNQHADFTFKSDPLRNGDNPFNSSRASAAPSSVPSKQQDGNSSLKRSLRSQNDLISRTKSDLTKYFPGYQEFLHSPFPEPDYLGPKTPIVIHDKKAPKGKTQTLPIRPRPDVINLENPDKNRQSSNPLKRKTPSEESCQQYERSHTTRHNEDDTSIKRVDFSHIRDEVKNFSEDPLSDEIYLTAHRKAERKEKQLRNSERENAMHEKSELERLLSELKGPDWLRTMGISGITESEKKNFEPKRDHFIRGVRNLIQKFVDWKEQQKELKRKKEQASAEREEEEAEEEDDDGDESEDSEQEEDGEDVSENAEDDKAQGETEVKSDQGEHQDSSVNSVDSSALQLQREAQIAKKSSSPPPLAAAASAPFTSFYAKPYLRDAALGKHRRGRTILAFGHPLPDLGDREFALPEEFVTKEVLRSNARKRRRLKREIREEKREG